MKKVKDNDDEIKIFEKYKKMDTQNKILICLYIIIFLMVINLIKPYIEKLFESNNSIESSNDVLDYDISDFKQISIDDFDDVAKSSKTQVVFIGDSSNQNCVNFLPILKQAQNDYGYETKYLDIGELNSDNAKNILMKYEKEGFLEKTYGSTPMVLTLKSGKMIQGWVGFASYNEFKDFLNNSGLKK